MSDDTAKEERARQAIFKAVILERSPRATEGELFGGKLLLSVAVSYSGDLEHLLRKLPNDRRKDLLRRDIKRAKALLAEADLLPKPVQ